MPIQYIQIKIAFFRSCHKLGLVNVFKTIVYFASIKIGIGKMVHTFQTLIHNYTSPTIYIINNRF